MKSITLNQLEEGKYYAISFDYIDMYSSKKINIIEIQILIKLENSMKIKLIEENKIQWHESGTYIQMFDEIPLKYYRKEKLIKLNG